MKKKKKLFPKMYHLLGVFNLFASESIFHLKRQKWFNIIKVNYKFNVKIINK